jgi:hypothetical protein
MPQRKVLVVTATAHEKIQEKVDKAAENLGDGWFAVSAHSAISTVFAGGSLFGGNIISHLVTTVLMEKA